MPIRAWRRELGLFEKLASYIIRKNGIYYEAISGSTGKVDYVNTDALTVCQNTVDSVFEENDPSVTKTAKKILFKANTLFDLGSGASGLVIPQLGASVEDQHIILEGESMMSTILKYTGSDYTINSTQLGYKQTIEIRNFRILGKGIYLYYGNFQSNAAKLQNLFLDQVSGDGITVFGFHPIIMDRITVFGGASAPYSTNKGIDIDYCNNSRFTNLYIHNCKGMGLEADRCSSFSVERSSFDGNGQEGAPRKNMILGFGGAGTSYMKAPNVKGCYFEGGVSGELQIEKSYGGEVSGNYFGALAGKVAVDLYTDTSGMTIHSNNFESGGYAILLRSGTRNNHVGTNRYHPNITTKIDDQGTNNKIDNGVSWVTSKLLTSQTVNSTQTTIAHGLDMTPNNIQVIPTSDGRIWRSAASDATNIYLTADADGRTCDIYVSRD